MQSFKEKSMKLTTILLCLCLTASIYGQERLRIAVFETQGTASAAKREDFRNALVDGLRNNPNLVVLDRATLAQVMREQGLQMSDEFDEYRAVEVGRLAGADYIMTSSANSANNIDFRLVYRLVDIRTGETIASERERATANTWYDVIDRIADSKLLAENDDRSNVFCGVEVQTQDHRVGAPIPAGWRLPTLTELRCICEHRDEIGGFNMGAYRSSTTDRGHTMGIRFQFCNEVLLTNPNEGSIRLVRGAISMASQEELDAIAANELAEIQAEERRVREQERAEERRIAREQAQERRAGAQTSRREITGTDARTTVRQGFGLQLEYTATIEGGWGANLIANWRGNRPNLAFGVGLGHYYESWGSGRLTVSPVFGSVIWNFSRSRFSPFVSAELGLSSYSYWREWWDWWNDSWISEHRGGTIIYLGATAGVQYSFNRNFALKANIRGMFAWEYIFGLGVGAIYRF